MMIATIVNVITTKTARMPINVILASLPVPDRELVEDITDTEVCEPSKNTRNNYLIFPKCVY
jgi:hypothetical protein